MLFCSQLCKVDKYFSGVVYEIRDETKKREWMVKQKRKPLSFLCRIIMENVVVNETEALGIPPNKGNRGQYFVYTLRFYK